MRTLTFVVVLAASVAAQSSAVTVGTASPRAGEVAYGALQVPAATDAATTIPVAVIRGEFGGRDVGGGVHWLELSSIVQV